MNIQKTTLEYESLILSMKEQREIAIQENNESKEITIEAIDYMIISFRKKIHRLNSL